MAKKTTTRSRTLEIAAACFAAGIATGWWLHAGLPTPIDRHPRIEARPSSDATTDDSSTAAHAAPVDPPEDGDAAAERRAVTPEVASVAHLPRLAETAAIEELRRRNLKLPLDGFTIGSLKGDFEARRGANKGRQHEAADMMAARDTPIRAVDNGTIAKLYVSKAGGRTIYQFDPTAHFSYYYAHLERYAPGLDEGQRVLRGEVIGYVGTSGNAPPNAPHLHFAIFVLGPDQKWWRGTPVDPYLVFKN